ncbi:MAG: hypothetical protein K2H23_05995 [Oscillospiraceae bacterium]|nr:hypothetical protein [Oscillospiraceae bacterium]
MNWLKTRLVILFLVFAVVGVMLTFGSISNIIKMNGDVKDFNYDSMQDIKKGDIVGGEIGYILDCYANETTTNTTMGVETSSRTSREYFIMPLLNEEDYAKDLYITVSASKYEDRQLLYAICDDTYELFDGNDDIQWHDMLFVAKVKKLDPDLNKYLTEWFEEAEYFDDDIQSHIVPFELSYFDPSTAYTNLVIGLIMLAVVIVVVFIFIAKTRPKKLNEVPGYVQSTPAYGGTEDTQNTVGGFAEESDMAQGQYISQPVQPDDFFAKPEKKGAQPEPKQTAEQTQTAAPVSVYNDTTINTANLNAEQSLYEQEQAIAANTKHVEYTNNLDTSELDAEKGLYEQEQVVAANKKQVEYTNELDTSDMNAEQSLYEQEQAIAANTKQVEYTNTLDTSELDAEKGLYEQEQAVAANQKQIEYTSGIDTSEIDTDSLEYFGSSAEDDDDDIFEFDNDGYSGEIDAEDIELT